MSNVLVFSVVESIISSYKLNFYSHFLDLLSFFPDKFIFIRFSMELEKYELLEKIGGGSYGDVFKAKEKLTGRSIAVKLITKVWK